MTENISKYQNTEISSARPPVVVILGHVDHGKTKILDYIRKTKVAEGEAGGITQHIGAYQVEISKFKEEISRSVDISKFKEEEGSQKITFLDTPGHEAFSAIRSRGAKVADIAVLVVAADESVKLQTVEAIKIIEETQIPFIVAINKIDKENANALKVKQDLAEHNVLVEDWGGKVPVVEVSAKTGQGIDALLEMISLVAEIEAEDMSKFRDVDISGGGPTAIVIESHMDKRRGQVATMLVQNGIFKVNDWISAGNEATRIKSMENFLGKSIIQAGPSEPIVALGWENAPVVGEKVCWAGSREEAMATAQKQAKLGQPNIFVQEDGPKKDTAKVLNLIVKTDVASSLEAIDQVLKTIKSEEVGYRVVDYGVGDISESDIKKAVAMKALVVGFHTEISPVVKQMLERESVTVEVFQIIYELVESVKKKMSELLDPEINRIALGKLKVLAVFKKDLKSQVVGGKVTTGKVKRGAMIDVLRNSQAVAGGRLSQLQQKKVDVEEVVEGLEAGIRFDFQAKTITPNMYIREGDVLEVYEEEKIRRSL
ncbi:MAG: translation initiation factor IF-2 [Parcubacteria group bacterium Gr01-1014_44]|nr:MAG: translation initiation factor IF-2 [Parcubacteria group bacterium Gr01-1014_44]